MAPLLAGVLLFSSCSLLPKNLFTWQRGLTSDEMYQACIDAITEEDRAGLKALFSAQAQREAGDFDAGMDYLFNTIQGQVLEVESPTTSQGGMGAHETRYWCDLTTTEGKYYVFMLVYTGHYQYGGKEGNKEMEEGIYSLRVVSYEDDNYTKNVSYWQDMQTPGIYVPNQSDLSRQGLNGTAAFCRGMIEDCDEKIAQFHYYTSYEPVRGSFWFNLEYAVVLRSGGVTFAVVDVGLYPQYKTGGAATVTTAEGAAVPIEVLYGDGRQYAFLYEAGSKPSAAVVSAFWVQREWPYSPEDDLLHRPTNLESSYVRIEEDVVTEYEVISSEMLDEGEEGYELLYKRQDGELVEGYPIILNQTYSSVEGTPEKYDVKSWTGDYHPQKTAAGEEGYFLGLGYQNIYLYSSASGNLPSNYPQLKQDLLDEFALLESAYGGFGFG